MSLTPACYVQGTLILTRRGEIAVESLREQDIAIVSSGQARQIKWIGHRITDCKRHPRPHDVWPVRVCAGAFGQTLPRRDLVLSPDHSVFIQGVLIPVRYLINDATIVQEQAETVAYWHVELESHDLLLAEGVPCESYLDTGNRAAFANGGTAMQMHPDFAREAWNNASCAPLVTEGSRLAAARRFLLEQVGLLGYAQTMDAALHAVIGGQKITPSITGGRHQFHLPAGADAVRLVSRAGVPAHTRDDGADHRALGVAVAAIRLDGQYVSLSSPALVSGWHQVEPAWRWTDGYATLAVIGARALEIDVVITERYWLHNEMESQGRRAA